MSKSSKTQTILKDKVNENSNYVLKNESSESCLPCKAAENTLWRIYVHHSNFFSDPLQSENNYKILGDALQQFAGFTAAHVQSIFTSMSLLPSELHLVYSGNQQIATQIQNALNQAGIRTNIEAALKRF